MDNNQRQDYQERLNIYMDYIKMSINQSKTTIEFCQEQIKNYQATIAVCRNSMELDWKEIERSEAALKAFLEHPQTQS